MRRLLFTLFSILFLKAAAFSQGCFKAYYNGVEVTEICQGVPIQFRDCSCGGNFNGDEFYDLDASNGFVFGPADLNGPSKTYTFANAGTFTVTQLYTPVCDQNTNQTQRTFIVKPTTPPTFTATQCGHDSVKVTITDTNYNAFNLAIGSGSPVPVVAGQTYTFQSPPNTYTITLTGNHTAAKCGNSNSLSLTPVPAPV
jgi:hypothetical protein